MNLNAKISRKKPLGIILAISIVLVIVLFAAFHRNGDSPDPMYEGKPLSFWIEKLRYDDMFVDATTHQKLPAFRKDEEAIRALGTNCVPLLLEIVKLRDSKVSRLMSRWSARLGERVRIKSVENRHDEAVAAFKALGEKGAPAVPALSEMLQQGDVERARISLRALRGIGPAAHPSIRHATNFIFHPVLWNDVTQLIYSVGPGAAAALPALGAMVKSTNVNWRLNALSALSRLGTNTAPLIPIVLPSLNDQDSGIAGNALNVVNAARLASPEVKAALLGALQNPAYRGDPRWVRTALTNLFPEFHSDTNFIR